MTLLVSKLWGSETIIANNTLYCGKILRLNEGWQCSLHHHRIKDETFYILSGYVWFEHGAEAFKIGAGHRVHIAPYDRHRFGGITDAVIIEVSTPHSDEDVYRDEESRRRDA